MVKVNLAWNGANATSVSLRASFDGRTAIGTTSRLRNLPKREHESGADLVPRRDADGTGAGKVRFLQLALPVGEVVRGDAMREGGVLEIGEYSDTNVGNALAARAALLVVLAYVLIECLESCRTERGL